MKNIFWSLLIASCIATLLCGCIKNDVKNPSLVASKAPSSPSKPAPLRAAPPAVSVSMGNPIIELTSGCTDNGEEHENGLYITKYYCKNQPWKEVHRTIESHNNKFYNYTVYDNIGDRVGHYWWSKGSYQCWYKWKEDWHECTAKDFVNEIKNGFSKTSFTENDYKYIESLLISNCTRIASKKYEMSGVINIEDTYSCKDKHWDLVNKIIKPDLGEYSYTVYFEDKNFPNSVEYAHWLGNITKEYGTYKCNSFTAKYDHKIHKCTEDEFIQELYVLKEPY